MRAKDFIPISKPRNFVAKNAMATTSGAGAHKDKKKAEKQGDVKHKKEKIPMDEGIPFEQCPQCRGPIFHESLMNEKQDACYHKVRSRYKVWPSAYASGALVQCRKKGAKNWGTKKK